MIKRAQVFLPLAACAFDGTGSGAGRRGLIYAGQIMFQSFEHTAMRELTAERVTALRSAMKDQGIDGFIVPRADAHQGENVAPRDQRLAWLTGFTGSAGVAVVLAERAAIFVDGRYTLQAADQVDDAVLEIVPIHKTSVAEWLEDALPKGARLGYDAWLHGKAEIDKLRAVAKEKAAGVVSVPENLIDKIWEDQPPAPAGSVRVHPVDVAGEEASAKRARIAEAVAEEGATVAVLSLPDSIAWLLNIRGSDIARSPVAHGFALIHDDGRVDLAMDPDKIGGEVREHLGNEVAIHPTEALPEVLRSVNGPVLLDKSSCPLWFVEQFSEAGNDLIWGRDPCVVPKATKNTAELEGMRAAHLRDGAAMVRFLAWLDAAMEAGETLTEIDIVTRLEGFRGEGGDLEDISFDTIAGSGPNGAIVHYRVSRASNRTIAPGDLLLVDSGAQYPDGTTDVTRTMATGPVTDSHRRHFTLVLKGMIGMSRARWPKGLNGRDLDPLARIALWRAGLDYDHGTGHGVGACLNVHEGPQSLSRRGTAEILPGMILSNEPGFYVAGSHGIRIENLVIVTEPAVPDGGERAMLGFETLTWVPIDRRLIDPALLDVDEAEWLDGYHAEVLERIGPLVDGGAADWLRGACAPISATGKQAPKISIGPADGTVVVRAAGAVVAESANALILSEGELAPVFYLPRKDAGIEFMDRSETVTTCPWKGEAVHFTLITKSGSIEDAAWSYENPVAGLEKIRDHLAFYSEKVTIEVL